MYSIGWHAFVVILCNLLNFGLNLVLLLLLDASGITKIKYSNFCIFTLPLSNSELLIQIEILDPGLLLNSMNYAATHMVDLFFAQASRTNL